MPTDDDSHYIVINSRPAPRPHRCVLRYRFVNAQSSCAAFIFGGSNGGGCSGEPRASAHVSSLFFMVTAEQHVRIVGPKMRLQCMPVQRNLLRFDHYAWVLVVDAWVLVVGKEGGTTNLSDLLAKFLTAEWRNFPCSFFNSDKNVRRRKKSHPLQLECQDFNNTGTVEAGVPPAPSQTPRLPPRRQQAVVAEDIGISRSELSWSVLYHFWN